jgi:hypothetical protein
VGSAPSEDLTHNVAQLVKAGNYPVTAAAYCGISEETLRDWWERGRDGDPAYSEFAGALDRALAEGELRDVALIAQASETNWQAAAWRLERRNPERWKDDPKRAFLEEQRAALERIRELTTDEGTQAEAGGDPPARRESRPPAPA